MDHDDDEIARELRRIERRAAEQRYCARIVDRFGRDELRRRVSVRVALHRKRKHSEER